MAYSQYTTPGASMTAAIDVLYIDDSQFDRELVRETLNGSDRKFRLREASNRVDFEAALSSQKFDCVLSDLNILGFSGLDVFEASRARSPEVPFVILTGTGSEELAVEAMKRGVTDYILKSPKHIRRLPYTLTAAVEHARSEAEKRLAEESARQAHAELLHAARLSVLGEVASIIAHEVNQPIGAAKNYLHVIRQFTTNPAQLVVIDKLGQQLSRVAETVRKVRAFAANHTLEYHEVSVRPMVDEACALGLLGVSTKDITAFIEILQNIPNIVCDRVQIQQILINLIRNAVDAVSQSETKKIDIVVLYNQAGDTVEFEVSDTGHGIPESLRSRLFTPFTTTKPNGTGLGLSTSRSIAEAHGGRLWAEPRNGSGSVFRLALPVVQLVRAQKC